MSVPPKEGDEEQVKERKGIKILTTNEPLTTLPLLLAQINVGTNSYKLRKGIRKI